MNKGKIIGISIISFITVLCIVLFGFVFRLREQSVVFNSNLTITEQDILNSANIKNGKSIFLIDKEQAINNIEKTYPNVKVVQIKTTSVVKVEIVVRERFELFYTTSLGKHYVLDEDLKVLRITEIEPANLIKLDADILIDSNVQPCSFIGNTNQKETLLNFYKAMYSAVINSKDAQARQDICNLVTSVKLEENKIIILTQHGTTLNISRPNHNTTNKINICFSTINQLIEASETVQNRTITIYYIAGTDEYKASISPAE